MAKLLRLEYAGALYIANRHELRGKNMSESSENPDVLVGDTLGINMANI